MDEQHDMNNQQSGVSPDGGAQPAAHKGSAGPVIGIIIIIALLVFGGLYFWGAQLNEEQNDDLPLILGDEQGPAAQRVGSPNNSANAIEDDFSETDLADFESQIEADLSAVEREF